MKTISWFFLHFVQTTIENAIIFTWARMSSCMTSLFSLWISQTHMNSTSLWLLKNWSRILCTKLRADFPRGTLQFSMSQKTPMGTNWSEFGAKWQEKRLLIKGVPVASMDFYLLKCLTPSSGEGLSFEVETSWELLCKFHLWCLEQIKRITHPSRQDEPFQHPVLSVDWELKWIKWKPAKSTDRWDITRVHSYQRIVSFR